MRGGFSRGIRWCKRKGPTTPLRAGMRGTLGGIPIRHSRHVASRYAYGLPADQCAKLPQILAGLEVCELLLGLLEGELCSLDALLLGFDSGGPFELGLVLWAILDLLLLVH